MGKQIRGTISGHNKYPEAKNFIAQNLNLPHWHTCRKQLVIEIFDGNMEDITSYCIDGVNCSKKTVVQELQNYFSKVEVTETG